MSDLESILTFASQLAERAGDLIVEMRAEANLSMEYKGNIELVTNADLAADQLIINAIKEKFPQDQILTEESNPNIENIRNHDKPLWIIDPIDGTVNYAHHHNQVAISIAYAIKGHVVVAVVYCPFHAELFSAISNYGAWLNDQPIRCSATQELNKALIATGFPYDKKGKLPQLMSYLTSILENCADIRRLGSAALDICWVAMGRLDGYYESVQPWDFAAAQLIAKEAGAQCGYFITPPKNTQTLFCGDNLLISNPLLYQNLNALLNSARLTDNKYPKSEIASLTES